MQLFLTSEDDDVTCIVCEGDISQSNFPSAEHNPLVELLGPLCFERRVLLDLGQASFIDSSGVGWLVACHRRFVAAKGKLILFSVPPMIDQVLRLLQMHMLLTIKPDRASALVAAGAAKETA